MTEHDLRVLVGIVAHVEAAVHSGPADRGHVIDKLMARIAADTGTLDDEQHVVGELRQLGNRLRHELGEQF